MTTADIEAIVTALCFGAIGGSLVIAMYITFRIEERESTNRRGARPGQGQQRFQANSKNPWGKSNDMLADETHPSRNNED